MRKRDRTARKRKGKRKRKTTKGRIRKKNKMLTKYVYEEGDRGMYEEKEAKKRDAYVNLM
jgi:hypothetical protein